MGNRIDADNRCTGCNACVSSCPVQAISLKTSSEGFWYPQVSEHLCVGCGRCMIVCPVYGKKDTSGFFAPISYAGWNRNLEEHISSSSGGIFSALARLVLKQGGTVYGAAYMEDLSVQHIRIESEEALEKLRGSKYVQSFISDEVLGQVKRDLSSGRSILFSGTPCQIAAVNRMFPKCANLLTVDVVCHGVPSPKAWRCYLNEVINQKGDIESVNMRKKVNGWKKIFFSTQFSDNSIEECWFNDNPWGSSFVKNLFLRESCYHCEFKNHVRCSDISLGDFWEAARGCHKEFDDEDRGTSIVLVNSVKGREALEKVLQDGQCFLENIPYHWIPKNTYAVVKSSSENPKRNEAFKMLGEYDFTTVLDKVAGISTERRILRSVKSNIKKVIGKGAKPETTQSLLRPTDFDSYKGEVGILNVQEVDNYGAVLLCYALQRTIEDLGYSVRVIDYRPTIARKRNSIGNRIVCKLEKDGVIGGVETSLRKLHGKDSINVNFSSDEKKTNFDLFRKNYLNRTPVYRGMDTPDSPVFQAYVVGSDVVWKPDRVESVESDVYFLKFTDGLECNRVAYAASIGTTDEKRLSEIADKFSDYIQRFDHISIREATSVPYVQGMFARKVFACADPTLLQSREVYDGIADKAKISSMQKYIYFYMFGDDSHAYEYVNRCSIQLNLPVVCQCNNPELVNNVLEYSGNDGPAEFLSRIRDAEYIITDSFHGTVFSILFQKNFVTLSRGSISVRMEDLLERLGLQDRYVTNPEVASVYMDIHDYFDIEDKITMWKKESIEFLTDALNWRGGV